MCVSDNLDEVNGIALASRIQLRELRRMGHKAYLFGPAFHARPPRRDGADLAMTLAPGRFSMDQAGYENSELVVLRLKSFLDFLRDHPVDVIEFETPGPVSTMCMLAAKVMGIRTLSHYRTDIIVYSELLMKGRAGIWAVQFWTRQFTRMAGPVIVPSEAYRDKVAAMGVPLSRIHKLPRGVDLAFFRPDLRDRAIWVHFGVPEDGPKLLYVGRVSVEKNLAALCEAFLEALQTRPDLRLVVVGDGPYLEEMKQSLAACGRAHFTGVLRDGTLARAFASADLFVFPSLADTFGNSVVEALASGLPCLVSDLGGPREIVDPGVCGTIFDHTQPHALRDGILKLVDDPARLMAWREPARTRAATFSYEAAANAFWALYVAECGKG
jgi:glycosyltransferase involved in cell wall biosynthesis